MQRQDEVVLNVITAVAPADRLQLHITGFSPEPLSVMVHYSFHSEHYAWVLCTMSSTEPSATPSILNYRYYHRYYNPIVMREGGISGKVECVRMVTNHDIRFFFQSVGVHQRLRKCTVLNRWTTILRNVLRG